MDEERITTICRGCKRPLIGKPYAYGGTRAYDPVTKEQAKINHYGGFVCSPECDFKVSLDLEQSMPGHGITQKTLSCHAQASYKQNWGM
jgi:hypothetical protein